MARSSKNLLKKIVDDSLKRDKKIKEKYEDRGGVGEGQANKELEKEKGEYFKDYDLVSYYGKDAPKARSFNTRRKASGGKVTKKKYGGNLKDIPSGKETSLGKLPTGVRNKMGFKASGGKVTKMGMGGKCRGMGAATRGGAFTRNG